jgi:GTP-binding protein
LKVLSAEFVTSAADARAVPRDGLPQIALVGRSNVGKSTLINALTGRKIAHTSATPGKTRLANLYRVHLQGGRPDASGALASWRLYLVDLPGYGYARGSKRALEDFARITDAYFGDGRPGAGCQAALLVIDARHPALDADAIARGWLEELELPFVVVATKIDKLSKQARRAALGAIAHQHNRPALAVSAAAGEGLDELWTEIVKLARR